jgi:hypothetical protein
MGLGLAVTLTVGACGSKNDAEPRLIAGGGVGDGAIEGVINVHVIDQDTDEPISGATVYIGEAEDEEPLEGVTDSTGLIAFDDGSLGGATTITVVANDYVVATWFGADGANVTVPLLPQEETTDVDNATISGTIAGWDELDPPATNHFYIAFASYSQTDELGGPENEIEQPGGGVGLPPNVCASFDDPDECAWSVVSRTGTVAMYATVIDIDTKGTETDADDTNEVIAYAYALDLEVRDGVAQTGVEMTMVDGAALADVTLDLPPSPSALDETGILLGLELGDSGILMAGFLQDSDEDTLRVPALSGDFADLSYRAIAFAGNENDEGDNDPMSATLMRGITDLSSDIVFDAWLPMATGLDADGDTYSFVPVDGGSFHGVALYDSDDDQVWDIALLDGRSELTLPTIPADPRPSGPIDMTVDAIDGDVDLTDFAIDDFTDVLHRLSKARTRL